MIWWHVQVDKVYYNHLICEECDTYLVKAHTKAGVARFVEKEKQWGKVLEIRPATDSEYLDATRLIP